MHGPSGTGGWHRIAGAIGATPATLRRALPRRAERFRVVVQCLERTRMPSDGKFIQPSPAGPRMRELTHRSATPNSPIMNALAAFAKAIRTTLVLALVGFITAGSLAGPVSAAVMVDHHVAMAVADDGASGHDLTAAEKCPPNADGATHDMGDGSCCVGTSMTILGDLVLPDAPESRLGEIVPSDHPVTARHRTVDFLRPPSLTI